MAHLRPSILLLELLSPACSSVPPEVKKEQELLQGPWVFVSAQEGGKQIPRNKLKKGISDVKWVFEGDRLIMVSGITREDTGKYALDPTKSPKHLDVAPQPGLDKPTLCIYDLQQDQLTICMGSRRGDDRPRQLQTSPGTEHATLVLKRER